MSARSHCSTRCWQSTRVSRAPLAPSGNWGAILPTILYNTPSRGVARLSTLSTTPLTFFSKATVRLTRARSTPRRQPCSRRTLRPPRRLSRRRPRPCHQRGRRRCLRLTFPRRHRRLGATAFETSKTATLPFRSSHCRAAATHSTTVESWGTIVLATARRTVLQHQRRPLLLPPCPVHPQPPRRRRHHPR
jgi:hypothetical protein